MKCKEDNDQSSSAKIFWKKQCYVVGDICTESGYAALNGTFCYNSTIDEAIPIRNVIQRVLASEEYYK